MKRVLKTQQEPPALAEYKARFAQAPAERIWTKFKTATERREQVKAQLRNDQRGLCAYCENALIPKDESVEHFVARDADHGRELDWTNLLLCCAGGERPLPEEVADGAVRYDPTGAKTCGHAKRNSTAAILNPLNLPHAPRLFTFKSETGEIVPDEGECAKAGVDVQLAHDTIAVLGLKAGRLNGARLALINQLLEELARAGHTHPFTLDRERELAAIYLPQSGFLPAFFTTVRFSLGAGAEMHLAAIGFQG
jgi:uncharacterized protein (TIGR02646 family)